MMYADDGTRSGGITVGPFTRVEAIASPGVTLNPDPIFPSTLVNSRYEIWNYDPATSGFTLIVDGQSEGPGSVALFLFGAEGLVESNNFLFKEGAYFPEITTLNAGEYDRLRAGVTPTPEPATMGLLGSSLIGLGVLIRRRSRQ